ncbi:MAG: DUF2357 domain-containing protein, partial [Chloroflexia bacterium]|nr:DUF2357 domain-containing protein [Chloroflexia bacterium]
MNPAEMLPTEEFAGVMAIPAQIGIAIHDGPVSGVSPEHLDALAPSTHYLHEWRDYRVTCTGASWLEIGSERIGSFGAGTGQFQVRFENQLGLSTIRAFDNFERLLNTRHVEVISPKLGGPDQSLSFFRAMLADLTSERGAMSYMPRAQTSRSVQRVQRPPSLLVQYFFLINNAESIGEALYHIQRSPHRVLDDETEHISIFDLTEIDADVVLQLVKGGATFDRSATPPRLQAAPGGVWFRVPKEGFDSAENQFVKAVASAMADACDDVLKAFWLRDRADPGVEHRRETLTRLATRLRQFGRAPMFDEVGPMNRVPVSSRVLQRRTGYRDLNIHWQEFLQARDPVWQPMQEAIDLRDIATLYEYWVWFELCRRVQEELKGGRPVIDSIPPSEMGLPNGLRASFAGHGTLTFNARRQAYSGIWLRPDYLWEPIVGAKVGFDAKFRLARDSAPMEIADNETSKDAQAKAKAD